MLNLVYAIATPTGLLLNDDPSTPWPILFGTWEDATAYLTAYADDAEWQIIIMDVYQWTPANFTNG